MSFLRTFVFDFCVARKFVHSFMSMLKYASERTKGHVATMAFVQLILKLSLLIPCSPHSLTALDPFPPYDLNLEHDEALGYLKKGNHIFSIYVVFLAGEALRPPPHPLPFLY